MAAPPSKPPRVKTHHAATGYVYEYYFDRAFDDSYRFGVRAGAGGYGPVVVRLDRKQLRSAAGRNLSGVEEFAVAKMSLFAAFDTRPGPEALSEPYAPGPAEFAAILAALDLL